MNKDKIIGIVLLCLIVVMFIGIYLITHFTGDKVNTFTYMTATYIPTPATYFCPENNYGIKINLSNYKLLTDEQKQGLVYGFLLCFNYGDNLNPILNITLGGKGCNYTYNKVYWEVSDIPTEDDCINDNLCFIKWIDDDKK